ncbi:aspartate carbamoyltransferase catalytic subunit [Roseivivax sp. GX 12232]|uniref:aspartate carbamoyltransferase catalytic subunit n=1 Tax=Roseivivax sp. GX 12232 TaxID=2900547 RepID=UPI001E608000|nr:aspartate carbamoyltransferase catalytic subunit [Roseivivax sp. GX 12232]MCE0505659.1 aspartate carbamoyltransferase catalytic subunit [Roseivivax sp. GX 12232]
MTKMQIRASETGVTRLFHLDLPPEAVDRFTTQAGTGEYPLSYALGATRLRPSLVDVVAIRDLGKMPLSAYLAEAHGVTGPEFAQMRGRIDGLKGHVVILPSQAFGATGQTLTVSSPLNWVGTFSEHAPETRAEPIKTESTKGMAPRSEGPDDPLARGSSPLLRALIIVVGAMLLGALAFLVVR